MKVSSFTKPQLDYLRENCNFVNDEIAVFELRSQGIGLEEIAERLKFTYDGIKRVSREVNRKITVVLTLSKGEIA